MLRQLAPPRKSRIEEGHLLADHVRTFISIPRAAPIINGRIFDHSSKRKHLALMRFERCTKSGGTDLAEAPALSKALGIPSSNLLPGEKEAFQRLAAQ
jgi:hypothetical protein